MSTPVTPEDFKWRFFTLIGGRPSELQPIPSALAALSESDSLPESSKSPEPTGSESPALRRSPTVKKNLNEFTGPTRRRGLRKSPGIPERLCDLARKYKTITDIPG